MDPFYTDRASLPRNMIENSMFEEEPDVVDLAKDSPVYPLDPDEVSYEPRSSRLLVRGLGENELDEEEEDYESSARLLGMSFMNRSSSLRPNTSQYTRQNHAGGSSCPVPSTRMFGVGIFLLVIVASVVMVIYFLPRCTFTKQGCHHSNASMELIYPKASNGMLYPWTSLRLPTDIQPVHYDLLLHPNFTTNTFCGTTVIKVKVLNDTKKIVLHSAGLLISKITVQDKEVKALEYEPWQQIAIKFPSELKKDQLLVLVLHYTADLSNTYDGFYNSSYLNKDGEISLLAATQFEPLTARKAFPCFDEPAFKATFLVKIKREAGYHSLSNMPKNQTIMLPDGLLLDEFETSKEMSTYLVAFVVANFVGISKNSSETLVSVYAVPEKVDQLSYALDTAVKLLDFYNQFFGIQYPFKKLDLVAIPDFLAGAMENWGLITFSERMLLVSNHSSILDNQMVASVIAHEFAHQWFGNLVTMRWWNDIWVSEGFATYMQYVSIQAVLPELEIGNDYLSMRFNALAKDSLNSTHPVSAAVATPEQVKEMFDSISYEKGASILLMLSSTLKEEEFKKGLIDYLNKYRYQNADNEDLWRSLSQGSSSIVDMMNTWTRQPGFPLVTVNRTGNRVTLSQQRFLLTANSTSEPSSELWHIPLTYVNDSCSTSSVCKQFFHLKERSATLEIPQSVKWLKFNFQSDGFYIVHYEEDGWKALVGALKENMEVLTPEDRASLINNIFALSQLGKVTFERVLDLMDYLVNETQTPPVAEALGQLDRLYRLLDKRQVSWVATKMRMYIFKLFGDLMDKQSWDEESSVSKQELRSSLLEVACRYNRDNCTHTAGEVFRQWVESNGTHRIPADLMSVVFHVAAQSASTWEVLLQAYASAVVVSEKHKMLEAIASTQNVRQIMWLLESSLQGVFIQTQDFPLVIHTVSKSFAGYLYAWDFVKQNWDTIIEKFPLGSFSIQIIVRSTTSQFSTEMHLLEVQSFFESLQERGSQMRCVQEALETIRLNIRWMAENLDTMARRL